MTNSSDDSKVYLWINFADLTGLGTIGPFGSPLNFMIRKELGDCLLPGVYVKRKLDKLDEQFVVIECTPDRALAIKPAIELLGKRKIGRVIRTRQTTGLPNKAWECIV